MWSCFGAVLCLIFAQSATLAYAKTPQNTTEPANQTRTVQLSSAPRQQQLDQFSRLAHGLRSGPVVVLDENTFFIPNLHYDGKGPDAHFWAGNGSEPSPSGVLVPDEAGSNRSLSSYSGQNIFVKLPGSLTVHQIDYFGVWCIQYKHDFGHVKIPKGLAVPPAHEGNKSGLVMVQKCCPSNQALTTEGCKEGPQKFDPSTIGVYKHNDTHIDDEPLNAATLTFRAFTSPIECELGKYPLLPDEDRFVLLENGSLLVIDTAKFYSMDEYCLETIDAGANDEWATAPIVCFTSGTRPPTSSIFVVYAIGIIISSIFLVLTALVFLFVKEVRDARGKCVLMYSASLAAAFICLAAAQLSGIDDETCNVIGYVVQFLFVSSFTWLTTVSWETCYKIRRAKILARRGILEVLKRKYNSDAYSRDKRRLCFYFVFGCGLPLLALASSFGIEKIPGIPSTFLKPHYGKNSCWFDQRGGTVFYFYVPIGFAVLLNVILASVMTYYLWWLKKHMKTDISWLAIKGDLIPMYRSVIFILVIMAFCWAAEVISFVFNEGEAVWIAADIINSLQGLFVFVVFVLHDPVKARLAKLCRKKQPPNAAAAEHDALVPINGSANHVHQEVVDLDFLTTLRHVDSEDDLT